MRICAGCENEYHEDFKFCPECGRAFGGQAAVDQADKMNRHLRQLSASASNEAAMERGGNYRASFELSEQSLNRLEAI